MDRKRQRESLPPHDKWVLYYDGKCGLCAAWVRASSRMDLFHQISWTPYQHLKAPPAGLSWTDLDLAVHLYTGRGRLYHGFYAFRMLAVRLVPLQFLVPVLWFPWVDVLGVAAYRWVARHRGRSSSCQIPALGAVLDGEGTMSGEGNGSQS